MELRLAKAEVERKEDPWGMFLVGVEAPITTACNENQADTAIQIDS